VEAVVRLDGRTLVQLWYRLAEIEAGDVRRDRESGRNERAEVSVSKYGSLHPGTSKVGVVSDCRAGASAGEYSSLPPKILNGGVTSDSRAGRDYSEGRCRRRIECRHRSERRRAKRLQMRSAMMQTKFKYERIQDKCTAQADGQQRRSKGAQGQ
jgi:hypothetical protein